MVFNLNSRCIKLVIRCINRIFRRARRSVWFLWADLKGENDKVDVGAFVGSAREGSARSLRSLCWTCRRRNGWTWTGCVVHRLFLLRGRVRVRRGLRDAARRRTRVQLWNQRMWLERKRPLRGLCSSGAGNGCSTTSTGSRHSAASNPTTRCHSSTAGNYRFVHPRHHMSDQPTRRNHFLRKHQLHRIFHLCQRRAFANGLHGGIYVESGGATVRLSDFLEMFGEFPLLD